MYMKHKGAKLDVWRGVMTLMTTPPGFVIERAEPW